MIFTDFSTFLTVDPDTLSQSNPAILSNLINGVWKKTENYIEIPDPLTGESFIRVPNTKTLQELSEFKLSAETCPKSGLHNPIKNPERYLVYGAVCSKAASLLQEVSFYLFS